MRGWYTLESWAELARCLDTEMQPCQEKDYAALCAMQPRERIVKVWSTPTIDAETFFCQMAAGNMQLEKAHLQKTLFQEGVDFDQESTAVPTLMQPRIKEGSNGT